MGIPSTATPPLDRADGQGPSESGRLRAGTRAAARAEGLGKVYGSGQTRVRALDGVDVAFAAGRLTAVMGPSGSGKSTLMQCVAGLDTPSTGRVWVGDSELSALGDRALTELRRDKIGFVFQAFNLVPTLSAVENITLPADIAGRRLDPAWLEQVIDTVGLRGRLSHRPAELSGGQAQRVACARALAGRPELILADEPTGNLDSVAAGEVLGFLRRSVDELGQTVVLVTHDPAAAAYADRVLFLADGRLVAEVCDPSADAVLETMKHLDTPTRTPTDRDHAATRPPRPVDGSATASTDASPAEPQTEPDQSSETGLGEAVRTARAARAQLDALLETLTALSPAEGDPADHSYAWFDPEASRRTRSSGQPPSAELAGERARRDAAEAAARRAEARLEGLRVELAQTRAAATAALELAVTRSAAHAAEVRAVQERWQAGLEAAARDQELDADHEPHPGHEPDTGRGGDAGLAGTARRAGEGLTPARGRG